MVQYTSNFSSLRPGTRSCSTPRSCIGTDKEKGSAYGINAGERMRLFKGGDRLNMREGWCRAWVSAIMVDSLLSQGGVVRGALGVCLTAYQDTNMQETRKIFFYVAVVSIARQTQSTESGTDTAVAWDLPPSQPAAGADAVQGSCQCVCMAHQYVKLLPRPHAEHQLCF